MARRGSTQLAFDALRVEGALIAPDMIAQVAALKAEGQSEADYRTLPGLKLRDEIGRYWRIGEALWGRFKLGRASGQAHAATGAFVDDLLREVFGFETLGRVSSRLVGDRDSGVRRVALGGRVPIAVAPAGEGLDRALDQFSEGHRKRSAALAVQELLNADGGALWGLATDGLRLRLLRDNASLTRPAFIEADLERIFEAGAYSEFSALWLLLHESRFGAADGAPSDCVLERWREAGREAGAKARDRLGVGVEAALTELGAGFIEHPDNGALRVAIASGVLTPQALYEELLRLVYRLIFLFTTEERVTSKGRRLLLDPGADEAKVNLYAEGYGVRRLRDLAARRAARDKNHDLYEGLKVLFRALWRGEMSLGLPALGGPFQGDALPNLGALKIDNRRLLQAIYKMAWIEENHTLMRVNWRDMETEELGSVYEALLELTPRVDIETRTFAFAEGTANKGNARKTSGSYYTPDSLVQLLLDSALDPVIDRAVAENPGAPVEALLNLTVIDPACGSGHFLLAAGRRIATRVAQLRSPGSPSAEDWRHALREVTRRSLFGVDRNPMAVELCRTALWIESVEPGKPLTFLDAHIQCGDSLVGVWDLSALAKGIPDGAYKPLTGDDKAAAAAWRKLNKAEREQAARLPFSGPPPALVSAARTLDDLPEDDVGQVEAKAQRLEAYRAGSDWLSLKAACDLYVAAFFAPKTAAPERHAAQTMPTTRPMWEFLEGRTAYAQAAARAIDIADQVQAFHWPLAFPQVMANGGFDCVVGNPPWEVVQLDEVEYFAQKSPDISGLAGVARKRAIADLQAEMPELWALYRFDKRSSEGGNEFARASGRFDLTAAGKINTYALFAEQFSKLTGSTGRSGLIVPTGVATDASTAPFFAALVEQRRLVELVDFENRKPLFQGVHRSFKFAILILGHDTDAASFACFLTDPIQAKEPERRFTLSASEIGRINPNTLTAPMFRARADAELAATIYAHVPILIDEAKRASGNPWGIEFRQGLFNMASDSGLFRTAAQLTAAGATRDGSVWEASLSSTGAKIEPGTWLPLFESKMFDQYNHRLSDYSQRGGDRGHRVLPELTTAQLCDPKYEVEPFYWVNRREVIARALGARPYWIGYGEATTASTSRTCVVTIFPWAAVGHKTILIKSDQQAAAECGLVATLNSLTVDYICRTKVSYLNLGQFIFKQLPVFPPSVFGADELAFIVPRVLELTYTSYAMRPWAQDLGYTGPPFAWDEDRRALLRAELDAYIGRLYRLTSGQMRYILDPKAVMGADYPSETFRVLQDNEKKKYGQYRTARLVMDAWDRLERGALA